MKQENRGSYPLPVLYSFTQRTFLLHVRSLILHGRLVVPVHGRDSRIIDVDLHGHHAARKRHNIIQRQHSAK